MLVICARSVTVNAGTICSREVVVCRRETSALDAARLIRRHHVGDLVVVDGGDDTYKPVPVGIVTDRDIAVAIVTKEAEPAALLVGDIMTALPVTACEWEDAWQVVRRMRLNAVRLSRTANTAAYPPRSCRLRHRKPTEIHGTAATMMSPATSASI
jgi:CBS domain-containing protein